MCVCVCVSSLSQVALTASIFLTFSIPLYHLSLLVGSLNYTHCPYKDINKFLQGS